MRSCHKEITLLFSHVYFGHYDVCMCTKLIQSCPALQSYGLQSARPLCPFGVSSQEYWTGLLCPPPEDLLNPGIEPMSPVAPGLAGGFFITSATWDAQAVIILHCNSTYTSLFPTRLRNTLSPRPSFYSPLYSQDLTQYLGSIKNLKNVLR